MFKKLINWLYWKYGTKNVAEMTRKQLGLFGKCYDFENLGDKDKEIYCEHCLTLTRDEILQNILGEIVEKCEHNMIYNLEGKNMLYERFTINGVSLVLELLEHYASQSPDKEVVFDRYDVV